MYISNQITLYMSLFIIIPLLQVESKAAQIIKPEKVYRIVYEVQTDEWYKQQAALWKKEIDKNPKNAEAWMNYYNANRYASFENISAPERQEKLDRIIEEMAKAIPNTYEYYVLKFKTDCDLDNISLIEKAYALDPGRPDTYYDLLTHYAIRGETAKFDEFCKKLYLSKDIAPWLMNYNYNVLMSTEPNAILVTNGDNDTYPVWALQRVKGIRPDVTILNISLSSIQSFFENAVKSKGINLDYKNIQTRAKKEATSYFAAVLMQELIREISAKYPQYPIYFALTVYSSYIEPFKENLYAVGLAYRYSTKRMDNIAVIKKNVEQNFLLDYLHFDYPGDQFPGKRLSAKMNLNYISPMMLLAEHYHTSGDQEKAEHWKLFSIHLAEISGNKEVVEEIKKKF